jgi:ubiquinone/menaquinone biosynthesis C-methylase UbiE
MSKWPKKNPELTEEQKRIRDDFMNAHLHAMQKKWYGCIERFNHGYPLRSSRENIKTLEIGAGIGAHLEYEDISKQEYHANELRSDLCEQLKKLYPSVKVVNGDCQEGLPYESDFFDRVLAIHVLEHLSDLPGALREIRRIIKRDGVFAVVIPCEGGFATKMARRISTKPHFEKKYPGQKYQWFIESEHINLPNEIFEELSAYFKIEHRCYYPLYFPSVEFNLCIGLSLRPTT